MTEIEEKRGLFYLGKQFDLAASQTGPAFSLDANHLTTHAAILGMTGSGKTGLGITLLEEALLDGVPAIILDPKGDITNLALTFPDLTPEDLLSWIAPEDAQMHDLTPEAYAEQVASSWRDERTKWDITPERVRQMRDACEICIYTPGSDAGMPVDVLQSLQTPPGEWAGHEEEMRERIQGLVSALLGLAGIEADPVQSREHILLAHLFELPGKRASRLTCPRSSARFSARPFSGWACLSWKRSFRKKIASHWPGRSIISSLRRALRRGGRASRSTWIRSCVEMASLAPAFFMLLIWTILNECSLSRCCFRQVRGWLRRQRGATTLRAILYFDEIFGYCPPYPKNPPSKVPLLTLVKQARAMGLGIVLATQNPVDLDYKGLSNIGAWFVGRLRTERDKARVLDGLEGAATESGSWDTCTVTS